VLRRIEASPWGVCDHLGDKAASVEILSDIALIVS